MEEKLHHMQGFEIWVDLGAGRSFREVGRKMGVSQTSVIKWSKLFGWKDRLLKRDNPQDPAPVEVAVSTKALITQTAVLGRVHGLMDKVDMAIAGCFEKDATTGKLVPTFTIKTTSDFVKLIGAQKDLVFLQRDVTRKPGKSDAKSDGTTQKLADVINIIQGLSNEQQVKFLRGGAVPAAKGDSAGDTGSVQDADYTDVPGPPSQE